MVYMEQGPAQGNSMTLNVDAPDQTVRQQEQSQYGRDILSIRNPMEGIEGATINSTSPAAPGTNVAVSGVQGVNINQAALQAGEAAFNSVLNFANQNGIDADVAQQIASAAREHARHIATAVDGSESSSLETSNDPEADELKKIEAKMQEAMQELELELAELEQRHAQGDPSLEALDEATGLTEYEKSRLIVTSALEGLQETVEDINIEASLRAASAEAREQAREGLIAAISQEDVLMSQVLDDAADLFMDLAQAGRDTERTQVPTGFEIDTDTALATFAQGMETITSGLVEAAEEAARQEQARVQQIKDAAIATQPGNNLLDAASVDTVGEIYAALQAFTRAEQLEVAEAQVELAESLQGPKADLSSDLYTTVA